MTDTPQAYGKYQLLMKLATGGQGEIFLAQLDGMAGFVKQVVIKRLLPHLAADTEFVNMLLDEARIVSRLSHPNVCQVYELGRVERSYYMAMEYLEGVTLSRILRHAVDHLMLLDIRLVCAILRQACEGLHHAHELRDTTGLHIGLVHRDVSPSNLFVSMDGLTKVLDFGIAKARGSLSKTRTGAIKGKYEYMSPEQVMRRSLDRRSDVFSLGIVLFEALTLKRLFYRDSEYEVFRAITEEPIPMLRDHRRDVPPALDQVVARALARDPRQRFASARELGQALMDATTTLGPPLTEADVGEYVRTHFGAELDARRAAVSATTARFDMEGTLPLSQDSEPGSALDSEIDSELDSELDSEPGSELGSEPGSELGSQQASRPDDMPRSYSVVKTLRESFPTGMSSVTDSLDDTLPRHPDSPVSSIGKVPRTERGAESVVPSFARPSRQRAGWPPGVKWMVSIGAIIVAGATGVVGALVYESSEPAHPTPVLVVEGEVTAEDGTSMVPMVAPPGSVAKDPYVAAFSAHQAEVERCLAGALLTVEQLGDLVITFTVNGDGRVQEVRIEPRSIADAPLGDCLRAVAMKTSFGKQMRDSVLVRIPIRSRTQ